MQLGKLWFDAASCAICLVFVKNKKLPDFISGSWQHAGNFTLRSPLICFGKAARVWWETSTPSRTESREERAQTRFQTQFCLLREMAPGYFYGAVWLKKFNSRHFTLLQDEAQFDETFLLEDWCRWITRSSNWFIHKINESLQACQRASSVYSKAATNTRLNQWESVRERKKKNPLQL